MDSEKQNEGAGNLICTKASNLYIQQSMLCDRGVYSSCNLKQGDLIECCPVLLYSNKDVELLKYTNLYNYHSLKSRAYSPGMLVLGLGSIYNHSSPSNAEYIINVENKTINIRAVSDIAAYTEITINYNGKYNDDTPVAFTAKNEIYEFSINLC